MSLRCVSTTSAGNTTLSPQFPYGHGYSSNAEPSKILSKMLRTRLVRSRVPILIFVLAILQRNPSAYNINSLDAEVFRDPMRVPGERGSYFGFSVALYVGANESLLLVGAPRANSSELPYVTEPGTVFKCAMNGVCKEWVMDKTGNGPRPRERFVNQIKDNAWIGATIAVQNKTVARVMVCGPRWINNIINDNKPNWYMNGICYTTLARNAHAFERQAEDHFLPLTNSGSQITSKNNINIYNYGVGQAGFSLHMSSRYTVNIAMGSPGIFNWKGDAILTVASMDDPFSRTVIPSLAREPRVHSYNYLGYAITAGTYFNEQDVWYASSAPQGANMYGKVLVFTFPPKTNQRMFIKTILYGQHYGEYFGAALTSCDVNNDGRQELIVGAPQWSRDMDEGHIYIFTARHNSNFEELQTVEGEIVGGRFGSTVMCLGDIDHDGYADVAVGAPHEEESGGAVYIYNGNRDGVSRRYSQRLVGSRFSPTMRGFGISISEPRDVNRDNHPDVAVGAYLSGEVVLLRSAPVVTVNVTLMYPQKIKLLRNTTSFKIDAWMSYGGTYVPDYLRVTAVLKVDPLHGRATYRAQKSDDGLQTYRLRYTLFKATITSNLLEIHLMGNIQNVIDPLEISVSMQLDDDLHARNESSLCASCVVINKLRSKTEDSLKLPFAVDCGEDNVCVSDLGVTLSTDSTPGNRYIIGSTPIIVLRVDTYNRGEPAYQTRVRIFTEVLTLASIPPECTEDPRASGTLDVICDIGNPLRTNKTLMLQLDTSMVRYDVREIEVQANVTTQSDEANWNDNNYTITVYFDVDIDIAIAGKAQENLYSYLRENEKKSLSDIRFQHFYEVQKFGVSPIEEAMLTVKIPTYFRRSNAEDVAIVNVNDIIGIMDGYQFYCSDSNQTEVLSVALNKIASTNDVIVMNTSSIASNNTHAKFSIEEDTPMHVPSENRTLYINCTSDAVECVQITCRLGPFLSSLSVAKFLVTMDLQLSSFPAEMLKHKDIIFYVTEGSVVITQPDKIAQREGHKPDVTLVATTFLGSPIAQRVAIWIIALSVILGVALLILLVLGLIKIGFFNRKKREELEALKAETDKKYNVVLDTTSSTEALDHD
ncbi:PREDICTED: integrin alpha pat-2-like [Vollenhovia emeryi]|uniref:integrin alpha pat-2-like n=1 Tax=Vollenhovia emeryi TaxID=411798 RepID=UPI0005F50F3F|nr:PREDICTED: integrin alpha pat-2-like [Vollenhovia emeryi]